MLAVVATLVFAFAAANASAAITIRVNDTTDAELASAATTCESEDAGKGCTLRAAVELANSTHDEEVTIEVPAGEYALTLHEELTVADGPKVTIVGAGAATTVINGESADSRVLRVESGGSLRLEGVTVEHGDEDEGAGIAVEDDAALTLESSAVEENVANDEGGGVLAYFDSTVTIKESTIANNKGGFDGGGLLAQGGSTVVVDGSKIDHNEASEDGGGIAAFSEASLTIEGSTIEEDSAEQGGGVFGEDAEVAIERSTVDGNTALGEGGGRGAGIYSRTDECDGVVEGSLTVRQSTIDENVAAETHDGEGGGIYAFSGFDECEGPAKVHANSHPRPAQEPFSEELDALTVEQSAIARNVAGGDGGGEGGGILEDGGFIRTEVKHDPIVDSTIADNHAGDEGGGVYTRDGALAILISDTVADNLSESAETGNNLATGEEEVSAIALRNTIVAEEAGEHEQNCSGEVGPLDEGAGYNLDFPSTTPDESSSDECGLSEEDHDLVNVAPGFEGGLANHEGSTQTIALAAASKAIGAVPLADCVDFEEEPLKVDQRGKPRPGIAGKGCDVGAYEYQEVKPAEKKTEPPKEETHATATTSVLPIKITSPPQCTSLRDITIHIQHVKQLGVVSAVVSIDGKQMRTLRGKRLTTGINLRGLPKGTFTVEIVARTRGGHTLRGKRIYHTCHTKLPGHSFLRL